MVRMGLISYSVLKRLVSGIGFRPAARWGWDRYCHTNIISMPMKSTAGMLNIRPFNPKIDWVNKDQEKDASVVALNNNSKNRILDEPHQDKRFSKDEQRAMKRMKSLWASLFDSPHGLDDETFNVKFSLDDWVEDRKEIPSGDLKRILNKLCKDGRFSLALKVFEWMGEKGIYEFSSRDHAVQINLIGKVRGCSAAERYVRNLPEQARNDKTYGELLHCYVHEHRTGEALLHFQKMKELGFALSPRPFNEMMHVYAKSLQIEKVLGVLAELKKSKVSPDNESYRICISSFGLNYDVDGMERMLREMETQPHIVMDWCTYAVVAELYEREFLVDKATDALEKAKMMLQKKKKKKNSSSHGYLMSSDYENVIKSLVKLGELDEAMKFVKEWEVLGNWRSVNDISIPCTIVQEYIKKGSLQKASNKVREWTYKGRPGVDKLSRLLCNEYLKADDLFQAHRCFQGRSYVGGLEVDRMFLQYLEEECGSIFPLCCSSGWCTRSLKTAEGKTFLELIPMNVKYTLRVPLLAAQHPENEKSTTPQEVNMDYENIIKSLVESGELDEARKMAMGWEASGNLTSLDDLNISKLIMDGYCERSLFMEAEAMAEAWTTREEKCCWVGGIWLILACHYQEHGKMVRGFECMRRFLDLTPSIKDRDCVEIDLFLCIIEYSRRVTAAGFFRHGEDVFFDLYDALCPYAP